ncbi:hypothetical protein U1Q18_031753 [Sarracenia purpurea var. burkii]
MFEPTQASATPAEHSSPIPPSPAHTSAAASIPPAAQGQGPVISTSAPAAPTSSAPVLPAVHAPKPVAQVQPPAVQAESSSSTAKRQSSTQD